MADELLSPQITQGIRSGVDTFSMIIIALVIIGLIVFVIWYFWFKKQFKHNITLRIKTKGNTDVIYYDKYRYHRKKGVPETIQLWKTKQFKPLPPNDAKDFDTKGNEYIEGWLVDTGEIKYLSYEVNDIVYLTQDNKPKGDIKIDSIDLDDKEFYSNQYFEAQRFRNKGFLDWIRDNAAVIALLFIGLLIIVFWNDMAKSSIEVSQSNAAISKANQQMIILLESLLKDREYINYLNATGVLRTYPELEEVKPPN